MCFYFYHSLYLLAFIHFPTYNVHGSKQLVSNNLWRLKMLLKYLNKLNIFRVFVILLLLSFTIVSSSVYAYQSTIMTETSSTPNFSNQNTTQVETQPSTLAHPVVSQTDFTSNNVQLENIISSQTTDVPLVQSLTMNPSSVNTLYQDSAFDSFYENTVFIGDSISVGFANFCQYTSNSISSDNTYFLAKESCGAFIVTSELALTKYANKMPTYQGKVQYIEDSVSQIPNLEKVIICFGINDLVGSSPEEYIIDMTTLIDRILSKSPTLSIYIISIPCITETAIAGSLSNDSIQTANQLLQNTCIEQGWGFINLTEYLMNENMAICEEYSSDSYVHQNNNAYQVWIKVLRNYAYMHTKE